MLIGNDELQARQSQQAKVDDQVLRDSITLALGNRHSILLPGDLVREIQKVDERYDEHPNQIHEVPVKAQNLDIIGNVTSALVAHTHNNQSDYADRNVREVQAGNAEKRRPEQSGPPR